MREDTCNTETENYSNSNAIESDLVLQSNKYRSAWVLPSWLIN